MPALSTPRAKAESLKIHEERGPAEAARQTGIPKNMIVSWAKRNGVQTVAVANTAAAVEMAKLTRTEKMERLTDLMIEEAIRTVEDMSKPITVPGAFAPVELPKPAPVHRKDLAKTLHALFDKIQLATGGPTENTLDPRKG